MELIGIGEIRFTASRFGSDKLFARFRNDDGTEMDLPITADQMSVIIGVRDSQEVESPEEDIHQESEDVVFPDFDTSVTSEFENDEELPIQLANVASMGSYGSYEDDEDDDL